MRMPILALCMMLGCDREPQAPAASFGAPLSAAAPVELSQVIASPREWDGKTVKVSAQANAVCQKKGCWMTLAAAAAGPRVRVTFRDYGFFVPKDLAGRRVLAEGVFSVKTLPQAEAQHYADDEAQSGRPSRRVAGDELEFALVASGVHVLP